MNPRFKFRRIPPREDITEIKERCNSDSVSFKSDESSWNTTYRDDYVRHGNAKREIIPPPPVSISLGGGCLSPTREEMRSLYMNTFHPFENQTPTKAVKPPPDSEIIPKINIPPVLSTAQEEMLITSKAHREPADIQSARALASYNRDNHFRVGYDKVTNYTTTTASSYSSRGRGERCSYDNANIGTHIEFDKKAGLGPHDKQRSKRRWAPPKPDVPLMDQTKTNFDTGYTKPDYSTTTQSSFYKGRMKPPERCPPPPCAEFSREQNPPKWRTMYQEEFKHRKPIPNKINNEDLRKTHWDVGHDKTEWPVHEPPPSARREKIDQNQNESNIVFKGDGKMQFNTTTGDMIGNYDKSKMKPAVQNNNSRDDHIYIGSDKVNYQTTAKRANEYAGTGHPAQICEDPDKGRGCPFSRGGNWSPYVGKEMVDIKRYKPYPPTVRQDGSYYRQTHFELEATDKFKPRYSTTYWKTICKPTLQA
ncbi:hypothetical protein M9Y10_041022 [Tritrichomonas musculus]|uniref:Uncharacterized protein n=1 Tax=Tritrichomonas musculus TaxID=1915356 RepID=A0ABR2K504_9EUKA